MDTTYDIFKTFHDAPIWVESVTGLEQTKKRLSSLNEASPGDYFAYDVHEARIVAELSREPKPNVDGNHRYQRSGAARKRVAH